VVVPKIACFGYFTGAIFMGEKNARCGTWKRKTASNRVHPSVPHPHTLHANMCRVGWELAVSRTKGTSYWKHTASGQGLWPTSGKNKVEVLETEMLAVESAYRHKRLLAKKAKQVHDSS